MFIARRLSRSDQHPCPCPCPCPCPIRPRRTTRPAPAPPIRTLDLRGERVDDGLAKLDHFLDESMTLSRDIVFVVHGHGTGALRSAIRAHVHKHPAVARLARREANEGGDGVTVLFLKD